MAGSACLPFDRTHLRSCNRKEGIRNWKPVHGLSALPDWQLQCHTNATSHSLLKDDQMARDNRLPVQCRRLLAVGATSSCHPGRHANVFAYPLLTCPIRTTRRRASKRFQGNAERLGKAGRPEGGRHGGWKTKRGEENLTKDTPLKKWMWNPLSLVRFPTPSGVIAMFGDGPYTTSTFDAPSILQLMVHQMRNLCAFLFSIVEKGGCVLGHVSTYHAVSPDWIS